MSESYARERMSQSLRPRWRPSNLLAWIMSAFHLSSMVALIIKVEMGGDILPVLAIWSAFSVASINVLILRWMRG